MALLTVNNLSKYYGADLIFSDVTFQVERGEKVALVGTNGTGKSTLLNIVAGLIVPDSGDIGIGKRNRVVYLAQEVRFDSQRTLWQEMETAFEHVHALQADMQALEHQLADTNTPDWDEVMQRYGDISTRFELAGGYHIDQRIERTLRGLGFSAAYDQQQLAHFSGGQKTRAALACALLSDPDLLLLDEPTNHLDLEAMEWLEHFLKTWHGTLIVISHDRFFLQNVTQRTLELTLGRLEDYPAGYNRYLALRAERLERQMKEYTAQQEYIARTETFIRRYKAGQRSGEAKGREKRLNRLKEQELIDRPTTEKRLHIAFDTTVRSGDRVLTMDSLTVGYTTTHPKSMNDTQHKTLLHVQALEMHRGERIAIIGPNGSGKTTLLRTLVGEIHPISGTFHFGHNVIPGYYAQGHDGLHMDATVIDEIVRVSTSIGEAAARNLLGRFLFSGDDVYKRIRELSGGERNRVALAQLTLITNSMLIMDEPTNHLDIGAREALEEVLASYTGSILFVSHDRSFIDALADKLWVVHDGQITQHLGNYTSYQEQRTRQQEQAKNPQAESGNKKRGSSEQDQLTRQQRQQQKRLRELETEIEQLEQALQQTNIDLEQASVAQDVARIAKLGVEYADMEERLHVCYDNWVLLGEG